VRRGYLRIAGKKHGKKTDEKLDPKTLELWSKVPD
jgi:hypothetical protein